MFCFVLLSTNINFLAHTLASFLKRIIESKTSAAGANGIGVCVVLNSKIFYN